MRLEAPERLHANSPARLDPAREADWWQAFRDSPQGKSLERDGVRLLIREIDALRQDRDRWQKAAGRLRAACFEDKSGEDHYLGGYRCRLCGWDVDPDMPETHEPSCLLTADQRSPRPCPGYVPTGKSCEHCGLASEDHSRDRP